MDKREQVAEIIKIEHYISDGVDIEEQDLKRIGETADQINALFDEKYEGYKSPDEVKAMQAGFLVILKEHNEGMLADCIEESKHLIDPSALAFREVEKTCGDCGGSRKDCITLGGICEANKQGNEWCRTSCPNQYLMEDCTPCSGTSKIKVMVPVMKTCEKCGGEGGLITTTDGINIAPYLKICPDCTNGKVQRTNAEVYAKGLESCEKEG